MHPGLAHGRRAAAGPAGVIRLRAVRMRDGAQWSRIRLADRAHLEPWEPSSDGDWADRGIPSSAWPAVCSGLRAEARKGRMLPYVIELDGRFCGQLTIGNVTHGALRSAWIGYWVPARRPAAAWPPERWRWALTTASVRSAASGGGHRAPGECGEPGGAGQGRVPRRGAAAPLPRGRRGLARPPAGGRRPSKRSTGRPHRRWSAPGKPAGRDAGLIPGRLAREAGSPMAVGSLLTRLVGGFWETAKKFVAIATRVAFGACEEQITGV